MSASTQSCAVKSRRRWLSDGRVLAGALIVIFGLVRLPIEKNIEGQFREFGLRPATLTLELRERLGQSAFIAALGGYRALVASFLWITAHVAWENTEWGRMNHLMQNVVALQPRAWIYWDRAAWHMGWNASVWVRQHGNFPREALTLRAERAYYELALDYLHRGVRNIPEQWELFMTLGHLLADKMNDPCGSSKAYREGSQRVGAPGYLRRFAAYKLAECPGHEQEAYKELRALYLEGKEQRLPTLITKLRELENLLAIPASQRLISPSPPSSPENLNPQKSENTETP